MSLNIGLEVLKTGNEGIGSFFKSLFKKDPTKNMSPLQMAEAGYKVIASLSTEEWSKFEQTKVPWGMHSYATMQTLIEAIPKAYQVLKSCVQQAKTAKPTPDEVEKYTSGYGEFNQNHFAYGKFLENALVGKTEGFIENHMSQNMRTVKEAGYTRKTLCDHLAFVIKWNKSVDVNLVESVADVNPDDLTLGVIMNFPEEMENVCVMAIKQFSKD